MAQTDTPETRRPSPKSLLELASKEQLGKLKVFLGAAPGVGKTFAMLSAGRARKAEGADVVIGVVETHGRSETAALLDGLDILPRQTITYRNRTIMEFDVEAAIKRRPQLLLVDEFAHTNAPGALHAKRYQDVEEIVRAGIDVWTTLNIQHLESLIDVVERITGVTVRETVPDKILERADEIVIVDLPPAELIKRLQDGKVYLPENARRAVDQFFKPGNLTALRELALRHTTDRVDEKMLEHLRQNAIDGAWPTAERLLVCVGSDEHSERVVRTASRMAAALKSPWVALHLQNVDAEMRDRSSRRRSEKALRLAERLGADTARVSGQNLVAEILRFASHNHITQIVIGRSRAGWLKTLFGRSLSQDLTSHAEEIAVTIVPTGSDTDVKVKWKLPKTDSLLTALVTSIASVTIASLASVALSKITPLPNASLLFLLAVLTCAITFGSMSAIYASVLSFLAYNYFFIEPINSFSVAEPYEIVSLLIFLVVAFVTAGIAGRLREQSNLLQQRATATQALYDFSRKLSAAAKLEDVLWILAHHTAQAVHGTSIVLLQDGNDLSIRGGWPPEDTLPTPDWAAARWSFKERRAAGRFTGTMPNARFHFRPIGSSDTPRGVIGVELPQTADMLQSELEAELQSLIDQAALAIERTMLVDQAARAEASIESERLRGALLSSISHDLRTPLASIVGSVTSLRTLGDKLSKPDRADLLATIEEESARLSRFVSNLLDMTRLEAGALDIRRDWVDVADAVRAAVARARRMSPKRVIEISLSPNLPLIRGDASLLEQVSFNLLDNADKYGGAKSKTKVVASRVDNQIMLSVTDHGQGIPSEALDLVFEKFFRVGHGDGRAAGTGLGLSICRGLVQAMGGSIKAESPILDGLGTRMTIKLPIPAQPAAADSSRSQVG